MTIGVLRINDLSFAVDRASIEAFVDGHRLAWGISVEASGLVEGKKWRPKLTSDVLFHTQGDCPMPWVDALRATTSWREAVDEDGEPRALLYVFEHLPLYDCSVSLVPAGGIEVTVQLAGKCDLMWKPGYRSAVAVSIDARAVFDGVLCGRLGEADALSTVSRFLNPHDLRFAVSDRGISRVAPFVPASEAR